MISANMEGLTTNNASIQWRITPESAACALQLGHFCILDDMIKRKDVWRAGRTQYSETIRMMCAHFKISS